MDKVDIYVINLDRDTERLKKFKNNMKQYNYTRIKAIYGKEEDMNKYDEILYTSKFIVPKNVLGASLSHRKALKTLIPLLGIGAVMAGRGRKSMPVDPGVVLTDDEFFRFG